MCTLSSSNSLFGDPCVGTIKYLVVHYNCMGGYYIVQECRMSDLRCLCLLAYSGIQHILCCVFVLFFSSCIPYVAIFSRLCFFKFPLRYYLTFIKLYLVSGFIHQTFNAKSTLEKTERVIKKCQSIETGNTGYTRQRTKTSQTKTNTTQKTKKMNNTDPIRKSTICVICLV